MRKGPPATSGERMVWAATYAAAWTRLLDFKRKHGPDDTEFKTIALEAADEAWGALDELREMAHADGDFAADALAMIDGEP